MKTGKKFLSLGAAFCVATSVLFTSAVPVFASTNNSISSGHIDATGEIGPGDTPITVQDAVRVKAFINKRKIPSAQDIQKYDLDKDGKITSIDYMLLKRAIQSQLGI